MRSAKIEGISCALAVLSLILWCLVILFVVKTVERYRLWLETGYSDQVFPAGVKSTAGLIERFLGGEGYWLSIYKGYIWASDLAFKGGDPARAEEFALQSLNYHPFCLSALKELEKIYMAEGRLKRSLCCNKVADRLLRGDFFGIEHTMKDEEYVCCIGERW